MSNNDRNKCSVPGCGSTRKPFRKLPNPKNNLANFRLWKHIVNNPRYHNLSDRVSHQRMHVCNRHFLPSDFVPGSNVKLREGIVPTLNLPLGPEETGVQRTITPNCMSQGASGGSTNVPAYFRDLPIDLPTNLDSQTLDPQDFFPIINSSISSFAKEVQDIVLPKANEITLSEDQETIDFTPAEPEEPLLFAPLYVVNEQIGEFGGYKEKSDLVPVEKPYFKALRTYSLGSKSIHEVCRICLHILAEEDVIKLCDQTEDAARQLNDMLHMILPNLDLEVYPDVVICTKCTQLLAYSYQLIKTWLSAEEKLKKIVEKKKDATNRAADLIIVTESGVGEELTEEAEFKNANIDHVTLDHSYDVLSEDKQKAKQDNETRMLTNVINGKGSGKVNEVLIEVPIVPDKPEPLIPNNGIDLQTTKRPPRQKRERARDKWGCGPYVCETCGFKSQNLTSFRKHLRKHVLGTWRGFHRVKSVHSKKIMCDLCGHFFSSRHHLERHMNTHTDKNKCCNVCGKKFTSHVGLKKHINFLHLGLYQYHQCHICGKQLSYKESLQQHLKRHYGIKTHQCQICARRFYTPSRLNNHMQRVHDSTAFTPVSCQYCGKVLKYHWSLEKHIRLYHLKTQDDKNVCEICKKPYWKKVDLVRHRIQIHGVSGSKPA